MANVRPLAKLDYALTNLGSEITSDRYQDYFHKKHKSLKYVRNSTFTWTSDYEGIFQQLLSMPRTFMGEFTQEDVIADFELTKKLVRIAYTGS